VPEPDANVKIQASIEVLKIINIVLMEHFCYNCLDLPDSSFSMCIFFSRRDKGSVFQNALVRSTIMKRKEVACLLNLQSQEHIISSLIRASQCIQVHMDRHTT
jgi:hypothetical protein